MRSNSQVRVFGTFTLSLLLLVGLMLFGSNRFVASTVHAADSNSQQAFSKGANTCGSWSVVPSPNPSMYNILNSVTAISANDAWAVGYYQGPGLDGSLTEHWDGTSWSVIPSPILLFDTLSSVSGVASNDVWAVGDYDNNSSTIPQALHWNGTQWSSITMPNPAKSDYTYLQGVTAIASSDVWAVGLYYDNQRRHERTLAEHWNGAVWSIVATPDTQQYNQHLQSITAIASNDVWAVGYDISTGGVATPLIEHWDGSQWSIVPSINGFRQTYLESVARVPGTNSVWAVGYSQYGYHHTRAFEERWNGKSWIQVDTISPNSGYNILNAIAPTATNNIWAEGAQGNTFAYGNELFSEYYTSSGNMVVSNPSPGNNVNIFYGATAVPGTNNVWAVGYYRNSGNDTPDQTLIEFYC